MRPAPNANALRLWPLFTHSHAHARERERRGTVRPHSPSAVVCVEISQRKFIFLWCMQRRRRCCRRLRRRRRLRRSAWVHGRRRVRDDIAACAHAAIMATRFCAGAWHTLARAREHSHTHTHMPARICARMPLRWPAKPALAKPAKQPSPAQPSQTKAGTGGGHRARRPCVNRRRYGRNWAEINSATLRHRRPAARIHICQRMRSSSIGNRNVCALVWRWVAYLSATVSLAFELAPGRATRKTCGPFIFAQMRRAGRADRADWVSAAI